MIAILSSKDCLAGVNIKQRLLETGKFKKLEETYDNESVYQYKDAKLYTTDALHIYNEEVDKKIDADIFIFTSTHRSAKGTPSLCVHSPGNWADAKLGGKEKKLCVAPALWIRQIFLLLEKHNTTDFEVVQEVTHHGPYLEKPCLFIEIGSSEMEWSLKEPADVIVNVLLELIDNKVEERPTVVTIGGLHTMPTFQKLYSNYAIGHAIPKYMLEFIDKDSILQAIDKTIPKPELIVVDWKGLGKYKEKVKTILDELDIEWKKIKEF